jgi:hypothetical protein
MPKRRRETRTYYGTSISGVHGSRGNKLTLEEQRRALAAWAAGVELKQLMKRFHCGGRQLRELFIANRKKTK